MVLNIKRVLILDEVGTKCLEILNAHGIIFTKKATLSEKKLIEEIPPYDALVVRFSTKVTFDVLFAAKNLKVIACAGAYFGNIDLNAAKNMGVGVINAPSGDNLSACEYVCSLTMNLARNLLRATTVPFPSLWGRGLYIGTELRGRTVALIGFGEAARQIARRMRIFNSFVVCYDPRFSDAFCKRNSAIKMELNQIWPIADYIIVFSAPFDNLRFCINADVLRACKRHIKIIISGNIASFDAAVMFNGLNSGQVSGAAFDIYDEDLTILKMPIFQHPSVISTMHLGVQTEDAVKNSSQEAAKQLVNLCYPDTYETPISVVVKFPRKLPNLMPPYHRYAPAAALFSCLSL